MKSRLWILALLPISLAAAGQDGAKKQVPLLFDTVKELIESESLAVQAWGAYIAGRHRQVAAISHVRALLRTPPEDAPKEIVFVQYAALDALIRLEAYVPPVDLLALPARFKTHALLLMAKDPEKNQTALLRLIQSPGTSRACWMAVCNLLVPLKTPGLTAYLLNRLHLNMNIHVSDQENIGFSSREAGVTSGDGRFSVPSGFPPITLYHLSERPRKGYEIMASGKRPIHYCHRVVQPGTTARFGSSVSELSHNQHTFEYLAQVADVDENELDFKPYRNKTILWKDPESFTAEVVTSREDMRESFRKFTELFRNKKLLTEKEAMNLQPEIKLEVTDRRKDKTVTLPSPDY